MGIDLGLRDGLPAAEMARDLKGYLQAPDKLFRRVRDEHGVLRLSQAAKAYHPGQGVYRSSYKNTLCLTATETNIAYRTADHERWQQLDFVIGIEVKKSKNHPVTDVCDQLAGKYPKGFKFTDWHPHCRCYAIPILQKLEDSIDDKPIMGEVKTTPDNYNEWVAANEHRFTSANRTPYFIRENPKYTDEFLKTPTNDKIVFQQFKTYKSKIETQDYWDYAQKKGLTHAEALVINKYTDNFYLPINNAIRDNRELTDIEVACIKVMNNGLQKLDAYKGVCYRGTSITKEQIKGYTQVLKEGTSFVEKSYMSTSVAYDTATGFMDNTIFEIKSINGVSLERISKFPDEKEIMFKGGTKFKVISIEKTKPYNNRIIHRICFEEV